VKGQAAHQHIGRRMVSRRERKQPAFGHVAAELLAREIVFVDDYPSVALERDRRVAHVFFSNQKDVVAPRSQREAQRVAGADLPFGDHRLAFFVEHQHARGKRRAHVELGGASRGQHDVTAAAKLEVVARVLATTYRRAGAGDRTRISVAVGLAQRYATVAGAIGRPVQGGDEIVGEKGAAQLLGLLAQLISGARGDDRVARRLNLVGQANAKCRAAAAAFHRHQLATAAGIDECQAHAGLRALKKRLSFSKESELCPSSSTLPSACPE
jgi:hypothetical protein